MAVHADLWLHEELLLLSLDLQRGTLPWQVINARALAGAALTELLGNDRIRLEKKSRSSVVVYTGSSPLGDPVLDHALESIRTGRRPAPMSTWVEKLSARPGLPHLIAERLWHRSYVRREIVPYAFFFSRRVYPVTRLDVRERIAARLRNVLQDPREPDPRDAALLALLKYVGRLDALLDAAARKTYRQRIGQIVKVKTMARPVGEVLAAVTAS